MLFRLSFANYKFIYFLGLVLNLLYFGFAIFTFFGLVELYEPFFVKLLYQDLDNRFYITTRDSLSYTDVLLLCLFLTAFFLLSYSFLLYKLTLYENKEPEIKKSFIRKLFVVLPIYIGLCFLFFSFIYTFLLFFDSINENSILGVVAKFIVSLFVLLPIMVHNMYLLKQEGSNFVNVFFDK